MSPPSDPKEPRRSVWEDLAHGELSPEDEAVLRALAAEDEDAAAHYEAYRPLDAQARERFAETITEQLHDEPAPPQAPSPGPVKRPKVWLASGATLLAAAAALVIALWPASAPELPAYTLQLQGGLATQRGPGDAASDDTPPRFDGRTRLELRLRPARAVQGPVQAEAFLVRGERVVPWDVDFERAPSGALRVVGPAGELLPPEPGEWTVAVVIGRQLPDHEELLQRVRRGDPGVLRARLRRVE